MTSLAEHYRPRLVDAAIGHALSISGAVCLEGVRGCGKTWAATAHSRSVCALDDPSRNRLNQRLARDNVSWALDGDIPHLIDEWQLVPATWDGVRRRVDEEVRKGLFILCGSSVPRDGDTPLHSGFGRILRIRMRTMSLYESSDSDGSVSLAGLFSGRSGDRKVCDVSFRDLSDLVMRGGWPGNLNMSVPEARMYARRHIEGMCYGDLSRTDRSKDPNRMMAILRSLSRNEGSPLNLSEISRDLRRNDDLVMKETTVKNYVAISDRMFLTEVQHPFISGLRSSLRVGRTPRIQLADPSLAMALLESSESELSEDPDMLSGLFVSLCKRDLRIYASVMGGTLLHYRDGRGREVDAVVRLPDGRWGAFGIELWSEHIDRAAENLLRIRDIFEDDPNGRPPEFLCVLCGTEPMAYRREDGVYVVPICSLGP